MSDSSDIKGGADSSNVEIIFIVENY